MLNICAGENDDTQYIVELGGIEVIRDLINSESVEVIEQVINECISYLEILGNLDYCKHCRMQ